MSHSTPPTESSTLSLHDALPISPRRPTAPRPRTAARGARRWWPPPPGTPPRRDRKSTRLNSSHSQISYAVFCLKKKKRNIEFIRGDRGKPVADDDRRVADTDVDS